MKPKKSVKSLAKKRADHMLEVAIKEKNPEKSERYFEIAKEIGTRNKVRLGKEKQVFCKFCNAPPSELEIRLKKGERIISCKKCGKTRKIPFKPQ